MVRPEKIEEKKSLRELNWWRVGGEAEYFAAPETIEQLKAVWHWAWQEKKPLHIISGGSNVLIQDGLLAGVVLSLHALKGIEKVETGDDVIVHCLAGTPKSDVAKVFLQ